MALIPQLQFRYFPWRVYMRYVLSQALFFSLLFILLAVIFHFLMRGWLAGHSEFADLISDIDHLLILSYLFSLATSVMFSLWVGRRFFLPLGRLLVKARTLHTRRYHRTIEAEEIADENADEEWQELETSLDQIHRDLSNVSDRLLRGRQEINALMSAISEAILAVDVSGQAIFFNEQFANLFNLAQGVTPRLQHIFRSPDVLESFERAIHSGEPVSISATLQSPGDPDMRDYRLSVSPLRMRDSQEVYGALGIFHDISELKQAERIRIEFVGNASHELRTPLTSIKGYVETLREDVALGRLDSAEKFLGVITRNVDRLIALVSDLLDLSTIEGHGELACEMTSPREATEMVLRNLDSERASHEQTIVCDYRVSEVYADPRKLEQVITNLVHNAIKYIPTGKTIHILWERSAEGDGVLLHVRDNGNGMAKKHLARIFERFYRVDPGRAREAGGTGLGLAIVKHICLKHRGWVKVESEVGHGTEFTCFFPDRLSPLD